MTRNVESGASLESVPLDRTQATFREPEPETGSRSSISAIKEMEKSQEANTVQKLDNVASNDELLKQLTSPKDNMPRSLGDLAKDFASLIEVNGHFTGENGHFKDKQKGLAIMGKAIKWGIDHGG